MLLEITKLGLKVKDIAPFNYKAYYKDGDDYVRSFYAEEAADYHLNKTNLPLIKPLLLEFLEKVAVETRPAALNDLKQYLAEDWLIAAAVNSRTLNGKAGFNGHVIVIFDFDNKSSTFRVHDPGLPAHANWRISDHDLEAAFNYLGPESSAFAAVRA